MRGNQRLERPRAHTIALSKTELIFMRACGARSRVFGDTTQTRRHHTPHVHDGADIMCVRVCVVCLTFRRARVEMREYFVGKYI